MQNLKLQIENLTAQRQRDLRIRQLAGALMVSFRIPDGYDLVAHLTNVPCRSNREALVHWVRSQLLEPVIKADATTLDTLRTLLRYKFAALNGNYDLDC